MLLVGDLGIGDLIGVLQHASWPPWLLVPEPPSP
jgi:hypothetical protein